MKIFNLYGSLLAIVGVSIGFLPQASAIRAIFYRQTTQVISLAPTDDTVTVLQQFTVPAGTHVVNYSATAVNTGLNEVVRCGVRVNGNFVSNHAATVGTEASGTSIATISGVTYIDFNTAYTLDFVCLHNGGGGAIPQIDAGAEIAVY